MAVPGQVERLIGVHLIHMLDEAGYLQGSLEDLAAKLGTSTALVESVLATLQGFDPPGVFARDLAECLALQLKDRNRYDPQIAKLLQNLELLGRHDLGALKRVVGVDADELLEMITRDQGAQSQARPEVRLGADPARAARRAGAARPQRQLVGGAQQRHAAARAGQPQLLRGGHQDHPLHGRQGLPARLPAERQLAGEEPRPARAHDPAGGRGDRAPAGRLPDARHRAL